MKETMGKSNENKFKKYSIAIGFVGIILIMVMLFIYDARNVQSSAPTSVDIGEDHISGKEMWGFEDPENAVRYAIRQLQTNNIDGFLRICPIIERATGEDVARVVDREGQVSIDSAVPSANYWEYLPLGKSEMMNEYAELMKKIILDSKDISNMTLCQVDYITPKKQNTTEYEYESNKMSDLYGTQLMTEMMALLQDGTSYYRIDFTLFNYAGYWKIFTLGAELNNSIDSAPLQETSKEDYERLIEPSSIKKMKKDYLNLGTEIDEWDGKERVKLPVNYFLANHYYGKTPEETIKFFINDIQNGNSDKALCYGAFSSQSDSSELDKIVEQGDFARQIKYFYYHLVFRDLETDAQPLEEAGITGKTFVAWVSPGEVNKLQLLSLQQISEESEDRVEYEVIMRYHGESILTAYTLVRNEQGWQIESLSASSKGYTEGEVR